MKVYLCGPIGGCDKGSMGDWRAAAANILGGAGISVVSPLRGKNYGVLDEYAPNEIVERDFRDIRSCDLVLANMTHRNPMTVGSYMEMLYARLRGIPVVVVWRISPGEVDVPYFIRWVAANIFTGLHDAMQSIEEFWNA